MEISIGKGLVCHVDADDHKALSAYKWFIVTGKGPIYAARYCVTNGLRKLVLMHRKIIGLDAEGRIVDHRDGDGLNNRRANLRLATYSQNAMNSRVRSDNTTGSRGVSFESCGIGKPRRWTAAVTVDGKRIKKRFDKYDDAVKWAESARLKLHGEYAFEARA